VGSGQQGRVAGNDLGLNEVEEVIARHLQAGILGWRAKE